jgi:hypothetical protein
MGLIQEGPAPGAVGPIITPGPRVTPWRMSSSPRSGTRAPNVKVESLAMVMPVGAGMGLILLASPLLSCIPCHHDIQGEGGRWPSGRTHGQRARRLGWGGTWLD